MLIDSRPSGSSYLICKLRNLNDPRWPRVATSQAHSSHGRSNHVGRGHHHSLHCIHASSTSLDVYASTASAHPRNRLKVAPSPCLLSMKELLLSSSEFSPLGRHFLFCLQPPVSIQFQTFHSLIHNRLGAIPGIRIAWNQFFCPILRKQLRNRLLFKGIAMQWFLQNMHNCLYILFFHHKISNIFANFEQNCKEISKGIGLAEESLIPILLTRRSRNRSWNRTLRNQSKPNLGESGFRQFTLNLSSFH